MPQKPNTSIVIIRIVYACMHTYVSPWVQSQLQSEIAHYSITVRGLAALATGLATSNVRMLVNSLNSLNFHLLYKSSCFIEHMLKIIISTICSKGGRNKKTNQNTFKIVRSYVCVCLNRTFWEREEERKDVKLSIREWCVFTISQC